VTEAVDEVPARPSDAELITAVRGGDTTAYGGLYERHLGAARRAARSLAASAVEREDLIAEAFTRVLRALRTGCGPVTEWWPYLLVTMRNEMITSHRRRGPIVLCDELPERLLVGVASDDPVGRWVVAGVAAEAFVRLPQRWRHVLWRTDPGRDPGGARPAVGIDRQRGRGTGLPSAGGAAAGIPRRAPASRPAPRLPGHPRPARRLGPSSGNVTTHQATRPYARGTAAPIAVPWPPCWPRSTTIWAHAPPGAPRTGTAAPSSPATGDAGARQAHHPPRLAAKAGAAGVDVESAVHGALVVVQPPLRLVESQVWWGFEASLGGELFERAGRLLLVDLDAPDASAMRCSCGMTSRRCCSTISFPARFAELRKRIGPPS
jgi:DNA-directed RNA polymerase specialized sigma24 family protein